MKRFYKTTYILEVLSAGPISEDMPLVDVLGEAEYGSFSADMKSFECVEVDGKTMAQLLIGQRSDPEFLDLDMNGNRTDLIYDYEESSGNTVQDGKIFDSSGKYICDYSDDLAEEYLSNNNGEE